MKMRSRVFSIICLLPICSYANEINEFGSHSLDPPAQKNTPQKSRYYKTDSGPHYQHISISGEELPIPDTYNLEKDINGFLADYLNNFSELLSMDGTEQFQVLRSNAVSGSGVFIITFVQVENGIQYSHHNQITVDIEGNRVLNLNLKVFHPPKRFLNRSYWKSERDAESLALAAWKSEFPNTDDVDLKIGEIFISDNLHPFQRFWAGSYTVDVDLITGEVEIQNTSLSVDYPTNQRLLGHPDVKNDVCVETGNSPRATTCKVDGSGNESVGELTVVELEASDGTSGMHCSMDNGVICEKLADKSLIDAWVYINEWEKDTDRYSTSTDAEDFPNIDIVAHSTAKDNRGVPRADYTIPRPGVPNGNIIAPRKGTHPTMRSDVEPLKS